MKPIITSIFSVVFSIQCFAQQQIPIDLSRDKIDDKNVTSGTVQLVLNNALPDPSAGVKKYKMKTTITDIGIPVLVIPGVNGTQTSPPSKLVDASTCPGGKVISDKIQNINSAATEAASKQLYDDVNADIKKLTGDCKAEAIKLLAEQDLKRQQTFYIEGLKANQKVIVTIERLSDDGKNAEKIWEFTINTERKVDRWLIYYGFTYQPNIISKYDQYYSKADTSSANKFTVTKKNGNQTKFWENLSPTLMFTYLIGDKYHDVKFGVSAITATNFTTFSAGLGLSAIIGYNLNISSGVMFTQKNVLNGMYKEGDIVKQNLTFDQLHEKKWGPEIYFTIALRFDKNPFAGGSGSSGSSGNGGGNTTSSSNGGTSTTTSSTNH